mmetsp:Transcript_11969/g.34704  ORF Transcript_11969/g.34704 Transcript_11969/m.34704 type:complete len:240 (-) Transcript_11969:565-1284(-)
MIMPWSPFLCPPLLPLVPRAPPAADGLLTSHMPPGLKRLLDSDLEMWLTPVLASSASDSRPVTLTDGEGASWWAAVPPGDDRWSSPADEWSGLIALFWRATGSEMADDAWGTVDSPLPSWSCVVCWSNAGIGSVWKGGGDGSRAASSFSGLLGGRPPMARCSGPPLMPSAESPSSCSLLSFMGVGGAEKLACWRDRDDGGVSGERGGRKGKSTGGPERPVAGGVTGIAAACEGGMEELE